MYKGKKVLITGGFGFIGSHLIKKLIAEGAQIYIITLPNTNQQRLIDYIEKLIVYEVDITDTAQMEKAVFEIKPDFVFHLASYGVNSAHKDYKLSAMVNIIGSINLITPLAKVGCEKFINIGSSSEYGDSIAKEDMILEPVDIYGSTKASATIILHQIAKENNMSIVTLRPFGIFGESEEPHKIFCNVILNILKGEDVPLTNCEQFRDYCYVGNIVDAIMMAGLAENITNEVLNVASGQSYPLKYYIDLIFNYMQTDKKPLYGALEYRNNERFNPSADINKIKTLLNWNVTIPIEEGLKRTVTWYKENINNFPWEVL